MAPPTDEKAILVKEDPAEPTCFSTCKDAFRPEPKLLRFKLFNILFLGSIGSLFPYMAIYYKQLGLSPIEIGILFGVRPILAFFSAPMWGAIADKYNVRRCVLILACVSFTVSNLAIGHVPPPRPARTCPPYFSSSEGNVSDIQSPNWRLNESVPTSVVNHRKAVLTWIYREEDVKKDMVFILVFSLVGEFFFSSIGALGDTALIDQVGGDDLGKYSRQRSWGACGLAIFMLVTGGLLSLTRKGAVICGLHIYFTYYRLAFYIFAVVMGITTVIACTFKFQGSQERAKNTQMVDILKEGNNSAVAAEESGPGHSTVAVMRLFLSPHYGSWLFAIFYMGMCNGIILGFLFWHLENLGASQLLMGVAGGLASFSEFVFYYGAEWFVRKTGAMVTTYIAVLCYAIRFANYAFIEEPWLVLPSELLQGFTFATAWVAMVEYTSAAVPEVSLGTVMGILHGVYWGLGIGCGHLIGGALIDNFGARTTFKIHIAASAVVVVLVFIVQRLSVKPMYQRHTAAERRTDSNGRY